ncbi:N-formylglutamate amidohydrolase [Niabella yanshanensis]|uniref:N-formylglutamate amidohydrolase n=1 Tax=Niabella yanshanensis TaxID=577386 RepID=A0ABZ0W4C7_9BACT|nr:N-formylglutamate amidohydrolase [Niabella yanshanensis]WQD37564.1 N-formylglutamate amidohydrolase [Niabella yanshanensis]
MKDFTIVNRKTPILAFALHDGHRIDESLRSYLLLDEQGRAREEDPYTGYMIADLPVTTVAVHASRFQLDLNRVKEQSVYAKPEDAWGLHVWNGLPIAAIEELNTRYEAFYTEIRLLIEEAVKEHGYFCILDVHSYNHRRESPFKEADSETHPEINLGTFYNNKKWFPLCDSYNSFLSDSKILDAQPDVRQNIIFKGGAFAQWVTGNFGEDGAVLSIEFKKTFMDEWTGIANIPHVNNLKELLHLSVSFLQKN